MQKVSIRDEIASLNEYWSQKVIAEANGQLFKVAKGIGEINWHKHDDQDELFILHAGRMTIELRTEEIHLAEGELFVVPKSAEHRVRAEGEAAFLIVGMNITSTREGGKPEWSVSRYIPLRQNDRKPACITPATPPVQRKPASLRGKEPGVSRCRRRAT